MGASQRIKTKYVFRLPVPFLKTKRMNVKGDRVDDQDTDDTDDNVYAIAGANVPHTVRVRYDSEPESESDVGSDEDVGVDVDTDVDPLDTSVSAARRHRQTQRTRIVSWDGVKEQARSRWTGEQEAKLEHARAELARCQKAWSSEQEVWLQCIEDLMKEKTAHEGFINNRRKHSCDEQVHFRKAFDRTRRRSGRDQMQAQGQEQPQRLSRAHRTGSLPVRLGRFRGRN
ncbi:hypothetical protein BDW71DRAFT_166498 [Aspergillus fruticulosus]